MPRFRDNMDSWYREQLEERRRTEELKRAEELERAKKAKKTKRIRVAIIAVVVLATGLASGWFIFGVWVDSLNIMWRWFVNTIWKTWMFPGGWNILRATPLFWFIVALVAMAALYAKNAEEVERYHGPSDIKFPSWVHATAIGTALVLVVGTCIYGFMHPNRNALFYNSATTYVVADTNELPNSLVRIGNSSKLQVDFDEGVMPDNWERRAASATGAAYVMQKTGDTIQNSDLMKETVSYIYDSEGGSWTGIRNGINRQPVFGVASWSGAGGSVKTCEFKGDNELNKAFDSGWGLNLSGDIAKFMPTFVYDAQDMYGYCDGDKPVIVIPGAKVAGIHSQTVNQSYGVVTLTGSPSGEAQMTFTDTVEPGDLPGPAYPVRLVEKQREALKWSGGRVWAWQPPMGFEAAASASQAGNNTDFLLKSKDDGRLYWVTPLKPRNTQSETISAYALVPADEMTAGQLNPQRVYVLNDNDQNIVNFNDLENAVTQAVAVKDPGFFTGGDGNSGEIVEFIPTGTGTWRVFAERGGRAVYEIHVTGGTRLNTSVVSLTEGGEPAKPAETTPQDDNAAGCNDAASLSDAEIAECINDLSTELVNRTNTDDQTE